MRDPAENKGIEPSIGSSRASPDHDRATNDVYALIKAARDRMRVLSLTCDANDGGGYPAFDGCWSRPRMWEQYGDNHEGVCLLFDRSRLERVVDEQWPHAEGVVQRGARRRPARVDIAHPGRTDDPPGIGPAVVQYGKDLLGRAVEPTPYGHVSAPAVSPRDPRGEPNRLSPRRARPAAPPDP